MDTSLASAIIVPCSSRKTREPQPQARAVSLPDLPQHDLETVWLERLSGLQRTIKAEALYGGRGAALGRAAARATGAPLLIASAGLGLLRGDQMVPSYGLTVGARGDESIPSHVKGRFDPTAWWSAVSAGPLSCDLETVLAGSASGVALIALTRPYAAMMAAALGRLPADAIDRVRIFGWKLHEVLPENLHQSLMDYDQRLEAVLPGTRCDFPQRALSHFASEVLTLGRGGRRLHRDRVEGSLRGFAAPTRSVRPRASDGEVAAWLSRALAEGSGIGRLLRRIREDGIACEQARFARLYRQAQHAMAQEAA